MGTPLKNRYYVDWSQADKAYVIRDSHVVLTGGRHAIVVDSANVDKDSVEQNCIAKNIADRRLEVKS